MLAELLLCTVRIVGEKEKTQGNEETVPALGGQPDVVTRHMIPTVVSPGSYPAEARGPRSLFCGGPASLEIRERSWEEATPCSAESGHGRKPEPVSSAQKTGKGVSEREKHMQRPWRKEARRCVCLGEARVLQEGGGRVWRGTGVLGERPVGVRAPGPGCLSESAGDFWGRPVLISLIWL